MTEHHLRLEWIEAGTLAAHPDNWRRHPPEQRRAMAAALEANGWAGALLFNEATGRLLDGHLRRETVKPTDVVPVLVGSWTPRDEARIMTTLDPIAAMATADRQVLEALAGDADLGPDLAACLEAQLAADIEAAPINEPEPAIERPAVEPGDTWALGPHRLRCGDSTSEADVNALLDGARPALTVTDPPYGVEYEPGWRAEAADRGLLTSGPRRVGKVLNDDRADWSDAWRLSPSDVLYSYCAAGALSITAGRAIEAAGFTIERQIVWAKPNFPIGRGHYTYQHEPCWYATRPGRPDHWLGRTTRPTTLWRMALDENVDGGHSTQKPVEAMARPIRQHRGDVYEPFAGSGTTIIAATQLGRTCWAMELDPAYAEAAIKRWQRHTGQRATRTRDGANLEDLQA